MAVGVVSGALLSLAETFTLIPCPGGLACCMLLADLLEKVCLQVSISPIDLLHLHQHCSFHIR